MESPVRLHQDVKWCGSDRWKGHFAVQWIFIVDVPNAAFKNLLYVACPFPREMSSQCPAPGTAALCSRIRVHPDCRGMRHNT